MRADPQPGILPDRRPSAALGVAVTAAGLAVATLVIYPLDSLAPVHSLAVVYLVVVLAVASVWGLRLGLAAAFAGALVFNAFHLSGKSPFDIDDAENLVTLAVFMLTAVVASLLADRARTQAAADARREEADLARELSQLLLGGADLETSLASASRRISEVTELPSARIEVGSVEGDEDQRAVPLVVGHERLGTLLLPPDVPPRLLRRIEDRVAPTLARAFFAARTGWSAVNALLIVSGAFGIFRKDAVIAAGGYRTDTVGEDMELVVRLHRTMRAARRPYRIVYVPDPVCWTEAPESLRLRTPSGLGRPRAGAAVRRGREPRLPPVHAPVEGRGVLAAGTGRRLGHDGAQGALAPRRTGAGQRRGHALGPTTREARRPAAGSAC